MTTPAEICAQCDQPYIGEAHHPPGDFVRPYHVFVPPPPWQHGQVPTLNIASIACGCEAESDEVDI